MLNCFENLCLIVFYKHIWYDLRFLFSKCQKVPNLFLIPYFAGVKNFNFKMFAFQFSMNLSNQLKDSFYQNTKKKTNPFFKSLSLQVWKVSFTFKMFALQFSINSSNQIKDSFYQNAKKSLIRFSSLNSSPNQYV